MVHPIHPIEGATLEATVVDDAKPRSTFELTEGMVFDEAALLPQLEGPVVVIGVCRKCNHYPKQLWLPARYCHKCLMKAHLASILSTATPGEDSSDVREV